MNNLMISFAYRLRLRKHFVLCALLSLAPAQVLWAQDSGNTPKAVRPAMTVTTVRPVQASLPLRLSANGTITAWQEASVGSEANGLRLSEVHAHVGDAVRKGQVLAVFDTDSVAADVAQAKAAVQEAQALVNDAAANAVRARSFQASGMMSAQQISLLLTAEQTAQARLESARAMLAVQQLRLKRTQVQAPDNGIISVRSATVGAVAGPGTELFRLIRQGRLEWRAEVTSTELARLQPGMPATLTAASGTRLAGKVRLVAPTVDVQTRNALVYVDLATSTATANTVKAGMFARGEFDLGDSAGLTLPQAAIVVRDGFHFIFTVAPGGEGIQRVTQHKVSVGRRMGERVEVTQGLTPDATVVLAGAAFLNDGDTVRINNAFVNPVPTTPAMQNQPQDSTKRAQAATK